MVSLLPECLTGGRSQHGITGLETAIVLIAFVVVSSVFAFAALSAGLFSSDKSEGTFEAGLAEARGTLETRGAVIAKANTTGTFTVANGDRGITTDGSSIWVVEKEDQAVYKYDPSGNLLSSFGLVAANANAEGITTDGSSIWVVDKTNLLVYKHNLSGTSQGSFALAAANGDARGITTDGSSIWVVDRSDQLAYKYDLSGTSQGSFALAADNGDPRGITTDRSSIWVVDKADGLVYKYSLSGASLGSTGLVAENAGAEGITTDSYSIWVLDKTALNGYWYDLDPTTVGDAVDEITLQVANAAGGGVIDLRPGETLVTYYDADQSFTLASGDFTVTGLGGADSDLLVEPGEMYEITLTGLIAKLDPDLPKAKPFTVEVKPPVGAVVRIARTTPVALELFNNLK